MKKEVINRLSKIGIIPVVRIDELQDSVPLAKALFQGGIDCAEITFRSAHAKDAIQLITNQLPDMLVGAGTVLSIQQAQEAVEAGAKFIITPGFNQRIVEWCIDNDILIIPGISSASEIEMALAYSLEYVKFFPAQSSGGAKKIKDLSAPYQHIKFIPTGGINASNMHEYLSLPCVEAIGGSFMLEEEAIKQKDFAKIETLSKNAIRDMLSYELIHLGIDSESKQEADKIAKLLCHLFHFPLYEKPNSTFAGKGFEIRFEKGNAKHGHFGIYTPYPEKALYHLAKLGIHCKEDTITRNKKTNRINFAYLDLEIAGFQVHLINPDVKM